MKGIIRFILNALALIVIASYLPGLAVNGFWAAALFIVILGIMNALVRPLLLLVTLPVNLLTLGLLTFVINGLMFWLASGLSSGVTVDSFSAAFWAALCTTFVSWMWSTLLKA